MRKYLSLILALGSVHLFADDIGKYCSFYIKMTPAGNGYQVVKTSDNYINSANVLYTIYDMDAKEYKLLTIPRNDNPNFQCNTEYQDANTAGYCEGDFVLNEDSANKEEASNAITNSINSVTNSLTGFLGSSTKTKKKRKASKPFTPYPNPTTIKVAQENSDLLTSQFTKTALLACDEERAKQIAKKKQEEEQLKKDAQLKAKRDKADTEANKVCSAATANITKSPISISSMKAADSKITAIYKKYGFNSTASCRRKVYLACMVSFDNKMPTNQADRMALSNCLTVANSCKENGYNVCY